jgi:hypothetical protein
MKSVLRCILGVVAGLGLAFVLVVALELFSAVVHPVPADFTETMEEICEHVARYPDWVLGIAVIAWSATTFVSIWVARRIGYRTGGLLVALVLAVAIVFNITMLPYALWFKVVMLSCFAIAGYLGFSRGAAVKSPKGEDTAESQAAGE